ncbi:TPA: hypothetical protein ACH3X1_009005 [Trebouxia sp. C0004]
MTIVLESIIYETDSSIHSLSRTIHLFLINATQLCHSWYIRYHICGVFKLQLSSAAMNSLPFLCISTWQLVVEAAASHEVSFSFGRRFELVFCQAVCMIFMPSTSTDKKEAADPSSAPT